MFINKIINFYEGSSHKNKEMWFAKDELRSDFDISSRHQSDDEETVLERSRIIIDQTSDEGETTIANNDGPARRFDKEDKFMIDTSKIIVNYVREPSTQTIYE